ncbi:MAG: Wadjet anti-phage system protein JetD domain-containing protein, partial [Clostridium sp.]
YIQNRQNNMEIKVSLNERSFEIWGREKFLQKEGGKTLIKKLGLSLDDLYIYETTEPLPYYSHNKNIPQNVLVLENKDTFYSMRRYLIKNCNKIMGTKIGTLVYGGGKNINKTFKDFSYCVEPYLAHKDNTILYLGDIDYEGIVIYESLKSVFEKGHNIRPFVDGYKVMIDKYLDRNISLPKTKDGQNRNISNVFLGEFTEEYICKINEILINDKYIPQEILNINDF